MKHHKHFSIMALWVITGLVLAACGPAATPTAAPTTVPATTAPEPTTAAPTEPAAEAVTIRYGLWDSAQQPAYQACAEAFTAENPNITVTIEQSGWGTYWDGLTTGFVSGTAPDVFTDHLAKYPEFLSKNQLLDLQPMVESDNVDLDQYVGGLADLWVREGKRYGLPKDWDTIAVFYNADMFDAAGIDPSITESWTWSPSDGGTFQDTIAKLTLDDQGRNGLDPNFDPTKVVQWGFASGAGDPGSGGQTEWSSFAASTGFMLTDGPWTNSFHYDDPRVADTLQWWADLHLTQGYAPGSEGLSGTDAKGLFQAKKVAMTPDGSWQINNLANSAGIKVGIGQLPAGPEGIKTPINGLSDAIWSGTEHPNEAWQWVKFLASPACANIVGDFGVVFPAIQSGVDKAIAKHKSNGIDVSAFTDEAAMPGATFLLPIAEKGSEIAALAGPVLQDIFDGKVKAADALPALNDQINALFE